MKYSYIKQQDTRNIDLLDDYISELQEPFKTKSRLKDLKNYMSRFFENAMSKHVAEPYFYAGKFKDVPEEIQDLELSLTMLHHSAGKIKKIHALQKKGIDHECLVPALAILSEGAELTKLIKAATIAPKEDKKSKESPQDVITRNIHNEAYRLLLDSTLELEEALGEKLLTVMNRYSDMRIKKSAGNPLSIKYLLEDKEKNADRAKKDALIIIESFVAKNINKMSPVIKERSLKDVQGDFSLNGLNINGYLNIELDDSSKFKVTMATEYSISKNNISFVRYPTRFHDAYDSKNEKISNPSQNKLSHNL